MIRGTYADYVIQLNGKRPFLIEVKGFSLELSEKHLRQATNYGANEGIDWAILTNGRKIDLYKIIFDKPIDSKKIFSVDLTDQAAIKENAEQLQYLHRESVIKKELEILWKKHSALDPNTLACYLLGKPVINYVKKELKARYKSKFSDTEVSDGIKNVISNSICIENLKPAKDRKKKDKLQPKEKQEIKTQPTQSPDPKLNTPSH